MKPIIGNVLYYESHITIEPVFDERLGLFEELCKKHNFKSAKLLMQKDRTETPERSNKDTFATGHGKDVETLKEQMLNLITDLDKNRFKIWRFKIEGVLVDIKLNRGELNTFIS